jgi:hypothetical protein
LGIQKPPTALFPTSWLTRSMQMMHTTGGLLVFHRKMTIIALFNSSTMSKQSRQAVSSRRIVPDQGDVIAGSVPKKSLS